MSERLEESLSTVSVEPQDRAVVELARTYAEALDDAEELASIGPRFLACLEHLLMTPKARAAVAKRSTDDGQASPIDELKNRRRKRGATSMDSTADRADT